MSNWIMFENTKEDGTKEQVAYNLDLIKVIRGNNDQVWVFLMGDVAFCRDEFIGDGASNLLKAIRHKTWEAG